MSSSQSLSLVAKIGIAMVAVSLSAVGLTGALGLLRFEETYKRLAVQRLEVAAREIGRVLHVGLDLGLTVDAQENLPDLLRQYLAAHPDLSAIVVHACDGAPLVRADRGAAAGEAWRVHLSKTSWSSVDAETIGVGLRIADPLGGCAAGVAVIRSSETLRRTMARVGGRYAALGAAAAAAGVAAIGAAFLFGRRRPALEGVRRDLDGILAGTAAPPSALSAAAAGEGWERDLVAAYLDARPELLRLADANRAEGAG